MLDKKNAAYLLPPFFLALFPVLSLWAQNVELIPFSQVVRPLIAVLLFEVIVLSAAWLIFRDLAAASQTAAFVTLLAFSYGRLYDGLRNAGMEWAGHRTLLPVCGLALALWTLLVYKWLKRSSAVHSFFMISSIVLVVMPLFAALPFLFTYREISVTVQPVAAVDPAASGPRPDIYYIILDAYGRDDMLQDIYGLDNSAFISYLNDTGFYVAEESRSNYRQTLLSLPSSLNMDYLQALMPALNPSSIDRTMMAGMIWHSSVRSILAGHGYRYVAIDNGYRSTARDADILFHDNDLPEQDAGSLELNEYEGLLISSSVARLWVDWQIQQGGENPLELIAIEAPYNRHRAQVQYVAETAVEAADLPGDNFVFVHILIPHPPFVFGADGETIKHTILYSLADGPASQGTKDEYFRNYPNQLLYANQLVMRMVDEILARSDTPPIIILQGDHGPRGLAGRGFEDTNMYESFSILNAYYFPGQEYGALYASISPVNSFRVVLDQYFDETFELLPDFSYYSPHEKPFDLIRVDEFETQEP